MSYKILFTRHAMKQIQKLPQDIQSRLEASLRRIQTRPFDFVQKMVNHPYYKLRVGDYRIIMDIQDEKLIILVVEVGDRKNIYKRFG